MIGRTGFKGHFKCTASNTKIGRVAGSVNRTVQSVEFVIKVRQYSFVPPPPDFALGSQVRASASAKRLMPPNHRHSMFGSQLIVHLSNEHQEHKHFEQGEWIRDHRAAGFYVPQKFLENYPDDESV